jgi:hypothetical protein
LEAVASRLLMVTLIAHISVGESSAPTYEISASRLAESTRDGSYYDWPVHMAEKTWVQSEQFIEAYTKALELLAGKYEPPADPVKLDVAIAKAREQALKMASRLGR